MRPPLIYIAGPFTGPTAWDIAENVREAERYGLLVAKAGGMPVIPHANTHLFHGQLTAEFWYAGTLALMRACDGVFLCRRWRDSVGAKKEAAEAGRLGLPTFDYQGPHNDPAIADFVADCVGGP
jgi:hypothetical protein